LSLGQGSAPNAEAAGLFARKMADEAWKIASNSRLQPTMVNTAAGGPGNTSGKRSYSTVAGPDGRIGNYQSKEFLIGNYQSKEFLWKYIRKINLIIQ